MPAWPGRLIETPKGVRRILNDEVALGQGVPKSWLSDHYPRGSTVRKTVALHLLEYLSGWLVMSSNDDAMATTVGSDDATTDTKDDQQTQFTWTPPDLSPRSAWARERTYNLIQVAMWYEDPGFLIEEGMEMLIRHRSNYTVEGPNPTHLQLLWWEFPMESWDELREGCLMNFLHPPDEAITPNTEMTPEQVTIAAGFVEELVTLGVLIKVKPGEMVTNGPLFCLPKPGQPGQWRVLSDMR
jgi:hypothetical protein